MRPRFRGVVGSLAAALLLAALVAALAGTGSAATGHEPSANYTVDPHVEPTDHRPGDPDANYTHYADVRAPAGTDGYRTVDSFSVAHPYAALSGCGVADAVVFGVDRGDDDPGRRTDGNLMEHVEKVREGRSEFRVDFYDAGDLAGDPPDLDAGDEVVLTLEDCVRNPEERGWYRAEASVEGTTSDGSQAGAGIASQYYYVCDCESRSAAESTLGPPPSEDGERSTPTPSSGGGDDQPAYTANYTADPHVEPTDHRPGKPDANYTHHVEVAVPDDAEAYNETRSFVVTGFAGDLSECSTESVERFGVDRNGDDPGRQTDEELLDYRESSRYSESSIRFDFFEGDELAAPEDAPLRLDADDEVVLTLHDCVGNPAERGWYRTTVIVNGTTTDGSFGETRLDSRYFYICDCESREEARERLGPPPSDDEPRATETATPTPDPRRTPTGTSTPGDPVPATPTVTPADPLPVTPTVGAGGTGGAPLPVPDLPLPFGVDIGLLGVGAGAVLVRRRR